MKYNEGPTPEDYCNGLNPSEHSITKINQNDINNGLNKDTNDSKIEYKYWDRVTIKGTKWLCYIKKVIKPETPDGETLYKLSNGPFKLYRAEEIIPGWDI